MSGFTGGLQEGADFVQSIIDDRRKDMAYRALVSAYGPQAADPQAWGAALAAKTEADAAPAKIAGIQADTAKTQAEAADQIRRSRNDNTYSIVQALRNYVDPKTQAVDPTAFDRAANILNIPPDQAATLKSALTAPGGAAHLDTLSQALLGPQQAAGGFQYALGPDGEALSIGHTKTGQAIVQPLPGVKPTAVISAQTAQGNLAERQQQDAYMRAHGWTTAQIAAYRAATTAHNTLYGPGDVPLPFQDGGAAPPQPQGGAQPGASDAAMSALLKRYGGNIDAAIAGVPDDKTAMALADWYKNTHSATPSPQGGATPSAIDKLPPKGRAMVYGQAQQIVNQATNLTNMNAILDQVDKQISPYTSGVFSSLSKLPGSAAKDLEANLATLKAQGLTAWLQSLKNAQGQAGIGRVLQSEANAAMTIYGNMEQPQSPKQLQYHVRLFRTAVNKLYDTARRTFKKQWGVTPEEATGIPRIKGDEDFAKLPSGAQFVAPDDSVRVKH